MRAVWTIVCALALAACATPGERAAQMQADIDEMIQVYGPACEKLGFQRGSDAWRDCVLRLDTREEHRRYSSQPVSTSCIGHRGFFHCTTL